MLVDSDSYSSAELFARIMQLQKRATIIGDRTAGKVTQGRFYLHHAGGTVFGLFISEWDVTMSAGQRLEQIGVMPDVVLLPTARELAAGRDSVLAQAIQLAGGQISSEDARRLFPVDWSDPIRECH